MSKVFFVALCIALIASVAFGQVTLSWGQDRFIRGEPTVLNINTVNVRLNGLVAKFPVNFANVLNNISYGAFGYFPDPNSPVCVDPITEQLVAKFVQSGANQFSLQAIQSNTDDDLVDGKYPDHQLKCFIPHPTVIEAEEYVVNVSFTDPSTSRNIDVTIAPPTKGFYNPLVTFKSAKISKQAKSSLGSSSLDVEFNTDVTGLHNVQVDNGLVIANLDITTGQLAQVWCTSGKEKQFAEILFHSGSTYVVVNKLPESKNTIKCTFTLNSDGGFNVWTEKVNVGISIGPSAVYQPVDFTQLEGSVSAAGTISSSDSEVRVNAAAAYVKINSTIEFTFSKHIDTSYFAIDTSQQDYRGWSCDYSGQTYFNANVAVKGQTLLVTNIDRVSNDFNCAFQFYGSKFFKFATDAKQASVSVKVDGKSLSSTNSPGTDTKIYFGTTAKILSTKVDKVIGANDITYEHHFTLSDNFDNLPLTPSQPVLSLRLDSPQTFKQEDFASQLKCQISTPTSTQVKSVEMKFHPSIRSWFIELKDIESLAKWSLNLVCTRVINKVQKYGLEISPLSRLAVSYIDFVDANRFSGSNFESSVGAAHEQAEKQNGSYPGKIQSYLTSTVSMALSHNPIQKTVQDNTAAVTSSFAKCVSQDKYTITAVGPTTATLKTNRNTRYGNVHQAPEFNEYYKDVYGKGINAGDWLRNRSFPESFDVARVYYHEFPQVGLAAQFTFAQLYHLDPADDAPGYNTSEFATKITKEFKNNKFSESLVPDLSLNDFESSLSAKTKIDGCGFTSIFFYQGFEPLSDTDAEKAQWSVFSKAQYSSFLCQAGEKCTMNADCESSQCLGGVCVIRKFEQIPYYSAQQDAVEYVQKQYYNSATSASVVLAIAAVLVAVLF
jgi:hypothetical protein